MNPLLLTALLAAEAALPDPPPAAAGEPAAVEAAPVAGIPAEAAPPPAFTFRGHLEWITAGGRAWDRASVLNPGNRVLQVPAGGGQSELRPDLRLEYGGELTAVARPRFLLRVEKGEVDGDWRAERSEAKAEWIEGYATWRASDRLSVSYGLQNFQWGPAELVSPSNRIFHSTGFYRDPVFVVRGRHLVRVNASYGREWSAVLLAEVGDNGERPFVAGEPFEEKALAKVEYTAPAGELYGALTAGASVRSRGWFGEYLNVPVVAGLSAYADAVHTVGRRAWYPVADPVLGATFTQTGMETRGLRTTALAGLRYAFVNGNDLRVEYLFDEAGWTDAQLARAQEAVLNAPAAGDPMGLAKYLDPGFELLGREHLFVSLALPDLPPGDRLGLQARYLHALTDGSGVAFLTGSYDATDSVVAFASLAATHGPADGALSRLTRATVALGATVNW